MKLIGAISVAAALGVGLGAQTSEKTTKSKIEVKDGKDVTVIGCVRPTASGTEYMLTDVTDKEGVHHSYMLVADDVDVSKHVGHQVRIEGKAADRGDGKVEMTTKTKT